MQASLLASAALTAEVAALKQDLKGSEKELNLAKRQLEVYLYIPKFQSLLHEGVALVDCISFKVNMLHHVLHDFW